MNREIICELLTAKNVQVLCVENGKEALEEFEKSAAGDYQMILLDIHMPVMDGLETSRSIRSSSHPDASVIPIIAMTADVFDEGHPQEQRGRNGWTSEQTNCFRRIICNYQSI